MTAHNPGGVRTALPDGVRAYAVYGDGGVDSPLRYFLEWEWDVYRPVLAVGMMNPSCASHLCGDRTVAWCYRWAKARGFGTLLVVNSEPYRAADQSTIPDRPQDMMNRTAIRLAGKRCDKFILGYGQPKVRSMHGKGLAMARILDSAGVPLYVWGLSINGTPKHPLYLPSNTEAQRWKPA